MNYCKLPKIDLHCHLDGSLRPASLIELAKEKGIDLPTFNIEELKPYMIAPENCHSLDEYLERFHLPNLVLQTSDALERVTFEIYEDAHLNGVKYLELRFAPLLYTEKGLSIEEILESVLAGMNRACTTFEMKGNIILTFLRIMPTDTIKPVIDVAKKYLNKGIVAVDLCASENEGFVSNFVEPIGYAKKCGFEITIHAGETGFGQNVVDAIELLDATRIGHGIAIASHKEAFELVKSKNITLETCPTSNVQTKCVSSMSAHPAIEFLDNDILVTLNTDNVTVSNTNMVQEVKSIDETFHIGMEKYTKIYKNSVNASFANEETKNWLLSLI